MVLLQAGGEIGGERDPVLADIPARVARRFLGVELVESFQDLQGDGGNAERRPRRDARVDCGDTGGKAPAQSLAEGRRAPGCGRRIEERQERRMTLYKIDAQTNQIPHQRIETQMFRAGFEGHQTRLEISAVLVTQSLRNPLLVRKKLIEGPDGRTSAHGNGAHGSGFVTDRGDHRGGCLQQLRDPLLTAMLAGNTAGLLVDSVCGDTVGGLVDRNGHG